MTFSGESSRPESVSSRRMARRLLSGAGCATLTAYRYGGVCSQIALHALDSDGRVLVAARPLPDHPLASLDDDEIVEVRLDVTLEAAEPGLRITTATAHLLGALRWLGRAEAALVLAGGSAACHCPITGENPLVGLADLACAPGGRLGVIETERVMVHDAMGVSGHSIEQVLSLGEGAPVLLWSSFDALSAHEEVSELGDAALDILCTAVGKGAVAGIVCSHRPAAGLCPSLWGRVLCVDVAPDAVTLMRLSRTCIDTLQVWLPDRMRRACEVAPYLRRLVQDALLADALGS